MSERHEGVAKAKKNEVTFRRHAMDKEMWEMITPRYRTLWAVIHEDFLRDLNPKINDIDEIVVVMAVKDD